MSGASGAGGAPGGPAEGRQPEGQGRFLQRPERRLTILLLSTAVAMGFTGTAAGAFMLAHLSGVPDGVGLSLFPSHPFIQIFGFVSEFVMGVGYSLLPRFKVGRFPRASLAYAVYGAVTAANVIFLVSPFTGSGLPALPAASLLTLAGSIIFACQVTSIVRRQAGGFPEVDLLLMLSPVSLVLATVLLFLELEGVLALQGGFFAPQMVYLTLLGFAGSEIYAVQIRSVSFRQCDYRKRLATAASALQAAAVATVFVDSIAPSRALSVAGGLLFIAAAASVFISTKVLELAHPLMLRPAMTKMHYTIMRYNEVCILSAAFWLLAGCVLGVMWLGLGVGTFSVRDSFIHSIAIGFIGADITCFAPMLLPGLLGRKGPVTGLSYWPITLLNLGVAVRVAGNLSALDGSGLPLWEASSGPIIVVAMVWFLFMLKNVGVRRPQALQQSTENGAGRSPVSPLQNLIDVGLAVGNPPAPQKPVPVWFVEKGGLLYTLPPQGADTSWYAEVTKNPDIAISFRGRVLKGKALPVTDSKQVRRIVRLFKDKYGQRNFGNYMRSRANVGVEIALESE